jgi:hypothetical protein
MRVIQDQQDLLTIMECHFQQSISQAMNMAVDVQMVALNSGESESKSSCAYHYSFVFSGWWFFLYSCTNVALNGKYNPTIANLGFRWSSPATGIILPIGSEMKIRRQ